MRFAAGRRPVTVITGLTALAAAIALGAPAAGSPATHATTPARGTTAGATAAAYRDPPANGRFDYQIGGAYKPLPSVRIVDRDRTSHPAPGVYNICYVNAFQTQAYQDGWWKKHHPSLLLRRNGTLVEDPGWAGEIILDTSTPAKRHALARVIGGWIAGCAKKGFDAVEPDNLDSNTRSHHLLTVADNMDYAALLAKRAHQVDLAFAQKNDAELAAHWQKKVGFDFAIAEECQVYSECFHYLKAYGNHVIEIEYTDNGRKYYNQACAARGSRISIILRDRDVVPRGRKAYVYRAC